jgi:hypothetical protein
MRNGVYYINRADKIVVLSDVKTYPGLDGKEFSIVTWQQSEDTIFKKVLIINKQFKYFKRIGEL